MKHTQNYMLYQTTSQIQKMLPIKISKKKQNRINKQIRLFQSLAEVYLQKRNFPELTQTIIADRSKSGRYFKDTNMNQQKKSKTRRYLRSQNKTTNEKTKQMIRKIYLPIKNKQMINSRQNNTEMLPQKIERSKIVVNKKRIDKSNQRIQITLKKQQISTNKDIMSKINQRKNQIKTAMQQYRNNKNRYQKQGARALHSTMNSRSYIGQQQRSKIKLNSSQSIDQIQIPFSPQSIVFRQTAKQKVKKRQNNQQNNIESFSNSQKRKSICQDNKNIYQELNKQKQSNYQKQSEQKVINNQQLLKNQFQTIQVKKRLNNPTFIFQSEDTYIRKWLELNKWKQCSKNYDNFKLKWSYKEYLTDYNVLNKKILNNVQIKKQYYNHIKNNKVLTKEGLNQIFYQMQLLQLSPHQFIPRSYSLTYKFLNYSKNTEEFEEDYFLTCILCALKKTVGYFKLQEKSIQMKQISQFSHVQQSYQVKNRINQILESQKMETKLRQLLNNLIFIKKKQLQTKNIHAHNLQRTVEKSQSSNQNSKKQIINIEFTLIIFLSIILQIQINKKEGQDQNFQKEFTTLLGLQQKTFIIQFLEECFSQNNKSSIYFNFSRNLHEIINQYQFLRRIQSLYQFQSLSSQMKCEFTQLMESYYFYFLKKQGIKFKAQGDDNVWIIKPMHGSRGIGIQMLNNYKKAKKILQSRPHSKIIQKYIQNVWILGPQKIKKSINNLKKKNLQNKSQKIQRLIKLYKSPIFLRKFDIRQWVLLYPPCSYIFSNFYLKICSQQYQVKGNSIQSHLSNYSVNKNVFIQNNDQADSILSENQFYQVLNLINYSTQQIQSIRINIKDRISKILQINKQFLDHSEGCFQLIGFDIILDNDLNPWVIQANMSPACSQRSEWLQQMKKQMADKMFQIIFAKDNEINNNFKNENLNHELNFKKEEFKGEIKNQFQWNLIQSKSEQFQFYNKKCFDKLYLQVVGKKKKIRKQKEQRSSGNNQNKKKQFQ